jgi:hypothetical protein
MVVVDINGCRRSPAMDFVFFLFFGFLLRFLSLMNIILSQFKIEYMNMEIIENLIWRIV